ncbi:MULTISPECIES: Rib/alpha-like domain-containing protein, partial [unclassified Granulicatella]|uniref:Rib/alpha-like domain-containing protein n=2 Tax=unclassified Granulicatella TaxID=2630493 RepID=UPI001883E067
MYFNRQNMKQTGWRMIKKGKKILFGCSLVAMFGVVTASVGTVDALEGDSLRIVEKTEIDVRKEKLTDEIRSLSHLNDNEKQEFVTQASNAQSKDELNAIQSDARAANVRKKLADYADRNATSAFRNADEGPAVLNVDITDSTVTILTQNAVKVTATLNGEPVVLSGSNGSYSFERSVRGGQLVVKVVDKNGVEKTQTTTVEPITVQGGISANRPGIDVTNDFDLAGITSPARNGLPSETNVLYAGTEFESIVGNKITLNSTSWTQLATGWKKDATFPLSGHYVLAFQNPLFYENIDSISVNGQQFKMYNGNPSTWHVELLTKTFNTGHIGTKYENKIIINLKSGKSLANLGLSNTPISYSAGWVTGKDYKKSEGPNKLVAESIDNSWFSTNNRHLNASDNGVRNNFTGTKRDAASNVPPILKVLPDLYSGDSNTVSTIKVVYLITPSGDYGLLGPANTYQTLPYLVQQVPTDLLPFLSKGDVKIYRSNASGNLLNNFSKYNLSIGNDGIVDTRSNSQFTIAGKSRQADVDKVRNFFRKNLFNYTLGQPLYITTEYRLKNSKNAVELAKELNKIIVANNGTLNFEGWMGRETREGVNQNGGNQPGILRGSYANAFLDTNLLTLNAPDKQTYDVTYYDSTVKAGDTAQAIVPKLTDISTRQVEVPPGSRFAISRNPEHLSNVRIDEKTGVITATVSENAPAGTEILVPVTLTYPDGTRATVNAKIIVEASKPKDAETYEPTYTDTKGKAGRTATTNAPTFKDRENNAATPKVTYKLGDNAPAGASVDGTTGVVTYPIPENTAVGTEVNVPVVVTYEDGTTDNTTAKIIVEATDADKYTPEATPEVIKKGGTVDLTDNIRPITDASGNPVPVTVKDVTPAGTIDPNTPGDYTGKVEVTYPDGSKETVDVPVKVTPDELTVATTPVTVREKAPVPTDKKVVTPSKEGSTIESTPTNGMSVDGNGNLTGTPDIKDWGKDEEERVVKIPVTVKNGGEVKTVEVPVTVQRDTDGDGIPDVTDPDDDNDGFTDEEEKAKGTDPKDPNSKPSTPDTLTVATTPVTVREKAPVPTDKKVVTPSKEGSTIESTPTNGMSVDGNGNLTGTPDIKDWGKDEEERVVKIPVTVKNGGEVKTVEVPVTVQRDTDGDGIPDVTDPDDDNDGFTDEEEKAKGTD